MPYGLILIVLCCAIFYYRVGEQEYGGGWLLAIISVALFLIGTIAFGLGLIGNLLVQVALFFALTFYNMKRKPK